MRSPTKGSGTELAVDGRPAAVPEPPRTFLFTDVEGSTRLWELYPAAMRPALARHDAILRAAISEASGVVVKTTGDGLMAVFDEPIDAVSAAVAAQRALLAERWPDMCVIRVRMGIHTGDAESRGGDYFGPSVNRTARIMAAGHGGQILLSESAARLADQGLPDGARLRDLGEHRLKDLGRPERVFQVGHPALPAEFPALATLDLRPNNLPTETSAFVGRDAELGAIRERLDDRDVRLVTLTGPGGTGKTRLAIRAAADQIDRFTDGVFFVDLIPATDADSVLALVAAATGSDDAADRSPLDELRRRFRSERTLLVLDNFEHVTAAAPILVELLADCPGLKLLVTSRQALRVRGENVISVPPLSLPAAAVGGAPASAVELSQFEAIQLFVERARAVRSDFRLTDDNAAAVAEICRRLDGLPLAIELATARLNLFSAEALRDRLGSTLKGLGSGARDLPARQQTLRATIEWSYQLLSPREQRLFELLAVFADASVEAVEAVSGGAAESFGKEFDALEDLGSLVDKSLLRQVESEGDRAPRVVMLSTVREYATERLDGQPEFAAAARGQHARYFTQLAADATRATGAEGDDLTARLAPELDNLSIAWRDAVEHRDLERLDTLRDALWPIYEKRGWYHATIQLIDDLLIVLTATPDRADRWQRELTLRSSRARALTLLRGYTGETEDAYLAALALVKEHGEVPQQFPVLRSIASFHGFRAEFDKGIGYAHEILRLADAQDDASMRVDGYVLLGADTGFSGQLDAGLGYLDQAIDGFERDGYQQRRLRLGIDPRISCLTTSGFFLWLLGYPDRAAERARRAITLATDLDHPYSLAYAYYHAGFLHLWRREPEVVADRAANALAVAEASDLPIWRALGTCLAGAAASSLGRPTDGLRQIADGLDQYQGLRTPPVFWPMLLFMQAAAHVEAGTPDAGLVLIDEALAIAGADAVLAPLFNVVRGDLSLAGPEPDVAAATTSFEHAFAVAATSNARMPQLRAAVRLSRVAERPERAKRIEALRSVHATFTEGDSTPDLRDATELLG